MQVLSRVMVNLCSNMHIQLFLNFFGALILLMKFMYGLICLLTNYCISVVVADLINKHLFLVFFFLLGMIVSTLIL